MAQLILYNLDRKIHYKLDWIGKSIINWMFNNSSISLSKTFMELLTKISIGNISLFPNNRRIENVID
ncbi:hypothetical protein ACA29_07305 [Lederbergia galactosidilytica]|uniref:Uncharacterized protein n=1 Tax=Lederbergia galactosidilytica TaxID=217031 RepID=A0A0Q9YAF0_9BACI|nr:hypothetical protein ACA29_07305 [Lederbergia galactosidilytica]